jgi:hypothetical protein
MWGHLIQYTQRSSMLHIWHTCQWSKAFDLQPLWMICSWTCLPSSRANTLAQESRIHMKVTALGYAAEILYKTWHFCLTAAQTSSIH